MEVFLTSSRAQQLQKKLGRMSAELQTQQALKSAQKPPCGTEQENRLRVLAERFPALQRTMMPQATNTSESSTASSMKSSIIVASSKDT